MMKSVKYIQMIMMALIVGLGFTSCMDDDWKDPTGETSPFGNNSLVEKNPLTVRQLLDTYESQLYPQSKSNINFATPIQEGLQVKGIVTANDIEGNIYNEVMIEDPYEPDENWTDAEKEAYDKERRGIIICIAEGGLSGVMPVGQEVLIDLTGLSIGAYRTQPQIGVPYTATSTSGSKSTYPSRISRADWNTRFKLIGKPDASKVKPIEFDYEQLKGNEDELYKYAGRLVTVKGIEFALGGKKTYAPKSEGMSTGYGVMRAFKNPTTGKDYTTNEFGIRTSCYSKWAAETLPTGKQNITGILTCYKSQTRYAVTAQILLRQKSDVQAAE